MGWEVGVSGEPKVDNTIRWNSKIAIVCSLKYREVHSVFFRPRWSLAAVHTKCSLIGAPQLHHTPHSRRS